MNTQGTFLRPSDKARRRNVPAVRHTALIFVLLTLMAITGCEIAASQQPVGVEIPAFAQVDEGLSRGGQPSPEGLRQLARQGVKTIVSLRYHSREMNEERQLAESLGMRWVNLPMWYWWRPSDKQIRRFLKITADPAQRPVFVHCRQGRNRASIMAALYRIAQQGWAPADAYTEGRRLGMVSWNPWTRWILFHDAPRKYMESK